MPKPIDQMDDQELWNSFQKGSKEAFAELYKQNIQTLYHFGKKFTNDRELVKDSIQEIFTDFWRKRDSIKELHKVKVYLLKSLRYKLIRSMSQAKKINQINLGDLLKEIPGVELQETENDFKRKRLLKENIQRLPERQKEIIHLKYFQNLTNDEIAEVLNINYQSASNLLHRALTKLKDIILKQS
ncbi:MAG: sigma-70 family RNA polymerase sigma factor [Bacteroidia bacterium]|nr:sigma-70 family RNA polymerase sigma factor [Bacteroidia bacterium]